VNLTEGDFRKLPKTTIFRILFTLEQQRWIEIFDDHYQRSTKLREFVSEKKTKKRLRELAPLIMHRLLAKFQESLNLGTDSGAVPQYIVDACERLPESFLPARL